MFRVRDHIISLVAVFLALGLGILIGTGISNDMLVTQQRLLIEQMTKDYRTLRQERVEMEARVQSLTRDLYLWHKYQEALYPGIVTGVLDGRKIAIVTHDSEIPQGVLAMLRDADAQLCSIVRIETGAAAGKDTAGLGTILAALATGGNVAGDGRELMEWALSSGTVRVELQEPHKPDTVLLFLGERIAADKSLLDELVQGLDQQGIILVGLEWSAVRDSVMGELKRLGISTIDNAETVFGQFSLLSVLRGSTGSFGLKQEADEFVATF